MQNAIRPCWSLLMIQAPTTYFQREKERERNGGEEREGPLRIKSMFGLGEAGT